MKESQLFVALSRERGHTMGVAVEREGGHGGPGWMKFVQAARRTMLWCAAS